MNLLEDFVDDLRYASPWRGFGAAASAKGNVRRDRILQ